jgi:6 kDa early secretory antigenic target
MADPSYLNINFETLEQAGTDLFTAYGAAYNTIEELRGKVEGGLSLWEGPARQAYNDAKKRWDAAFAHMVQVLNDAHVHIGNTHDLYHAVENQNRSIWT